MTKNRTVWASAVVWALVTSAAWIAYVPDVVSRSSLLILSGVVALGGAVVITMVVNARPTHSINEVLHDAEQASRPRP